MSDFESVFLRVLIQLVVIIALSRLGAVLFRRLGHCEVVGEITFGLLIGPSVLGRLFPEILQNLFPVETLPILRSISEIGLIFLMFLIGIEFDFSHLKGVGRTAVSVAAAGCLLPLSLGILTALAIHPRIAADFDRTGFTLIVAVALSITAIPILGRIMTDFHMHQTPVGTLTITAAAIDDVLGWILLGTVSAVIRGRLELTMISRMLLLTTAFVVLTVHFGRMIQRNIRRWPAILHEGQLTPTGLAVTFCLILLSAAATSLIGIFSVFGPFVLGASLSGSPVLKASCERHMKSFVSYFFLPVFFTFTGLRTNAGSLQTADEWLACGLLLTAAVVGKIVGCGGAARLGGYSWRECGCVAVMMNTRALMGLITINVGRDLGVIPESVFCMLVIMAVATTLPTSPVLRRLISGDREVGPG
ncbi:MAG: cation:proton antiporter [Planctomycetaceae bacterium]